VLRELCYDQDLFILRVRRQRKVATGAESGVDPEMLKERATKARQEATIYIQDPHCPLYPPENSQCTGVRIPANSYASDENENYHRPGDHSYDHNHADTKASAR
jgi:hypothetical protein